jgi:hypothetical protein
VSSTPSAQREQFEPAADASDALSAAAQLGLEGGQRRRLGDPTEHAEQELVDEIDHRPACGWLVGDAERAQPRSGVLLAVQAPLVVAIPLPDRGELKVDPVGNRRGDQRASTPSAVLLEGLLEVLCEADVVPCVAVGALEVLAVGALEVQQVDDSVVGHANASARSGPRPGGGAVHRPPRARRGRDNPGGDDPATPRLLDRVY